MNTSAPGRALWLPQVLRDAGLDVRERPGWETRGKATLAPVGVVEHHTGWGSTPTDFAVYADWLGITGRPPTVPAPLANLFLDPTGRYWVVASGKANHAGVGGWLGARGNSKFIGVEAGHTGNPAEPWPKDQLEAMKVGAAAILRHLGRSADWVCGHKEYAEPPGRKIDPISIDMDAFRRDVGILLVPDLVDPSTLSELEIGKLRQLIASWESVHSNPTFPQYLITDYRRRQK